MLEQRQHFVDWPKVAHGWLADVEARRVYVSYTMLEQPIPDFALELVFSRYGKVDFVHRQSAGRQGVIQFATEKAAVAALGGLDGTKLLGQARCCQLCYAQHWWSA
jgi:hypothetical protein